MPGFDFEARDHDSGVSYEPWTNGDAVGFRCVHRDGRTEFIYLNPSIGSDDGVPTVFVYQGVTGDPALDDPANYLTIDAVERPIES